MRTHLQMHLLLSKQLAIDHKSAGFTSHRRSKPIYRNTPGKKTLLTISSFSGSSGA